jgi:hypothetical protein
VTLGHLGGVVHLVSHLFGLYQDSPSPDRGGWLTTIYGPARDYDKPGFLAELHALCMIRTGAWLLTSDFNLIYRATDKNNTNLNQRRMGQFIRFLTKAALKVLHLNGCLFTWSNEHEHLTLESINRAFVSADWDTLRPHHDLQSLSTLCSNHAPLLLSTD